jgi:hypothetical protein
LAAHTGRLQDPAATLLAQMRDDRMAELDRADHLRVQLPQHLFVGELLRSTEQGRIRHDHVDSPERREGRIHDGPGSRPCR